MLTFLIAVLAGVVCGGLGKLWPGGVAWPMVFSVVGLLAAMVPLNLWLKKRLEAVFKKVQSTLQESQDDLRRKANQIQKGFSGSPKAIQKLLEGKQADAARAALKVLDEAIPLYRWNILAERQTNTLRGQLYYQLREFEQADRCLKKSFILDAFTLAMKLARDYMRGDKTHLDRDFKKGLKRFKGDKGLILYALYSWILVKDERVADAITLLGKAKDDTENEVMRVNWEHLANGRIKSFTNAGLGDQWYALQLEVPKMSKVRQRQSGPWGR